MCGASSLIVPAKPTRFKSSPWQEGKISKHNTSTAQEAGWPGMDRTLCDLVSMRWHHLYISAPTVSKRFAGIGWKRTRLRGAPVRTRPLVVIPALAWPVRCRDHRKSHRKSVCKQWLFANPGTGDLPCPIYQTALEDRAGKSRDEPTRPGNPPPRLREKPIAASAAPGALSSQRPGAGTEQKMGRVVANPALERFGRGCLKGRLQLPQGALLCKCEKSKNGCIFCTHPSEKRKTYRISGLNRIKKSI